jgi:hypothetical protein
MDPMTTQRNLAALANALVAAAACACSSIGPPTVERDRIDYATAIADSWKQQTLLNVVKLRYGDMPVFLELGQVIAGYELESTAGAGVAATDDLDNFGASALAQGKYTDRPTLIYAPLTGNDFLKKLMTPIPPSALLFMLQSGYSADLIIPIAVNSINGVRNESRRRVDRAADPQFLRLVQLLRELQLSDALQTRIEPAAGGAGGTMIVFPPSEDSEAAAKSTEIRRILHLDPGLRELRVYYGGHSGKDNEISMLTRSMLQIMLEIAAIVRVPAADVASGRASPGVVDTESSATAPSSLLEIFSGDAPPRDAFVAVRYGDHSFWIADTDTRSKYTFLALMLLFSISDTGVTGNAPVVTVPAN